jgi:MFS family permease
MIKKTFSLKKIYYGWWVSLAGGINTFFSSIPTFSAGSVIFKAVEDEFGWSRAVVSGVASFGRFGGALLGPVEGFLSDRFGVGKMVVIGFLISSIGLFWLSSINNILFYYASYFVVSVGTSIGGFVPSMSAVNAWMPHQRTKAMSWVIGGSSFGGFFTPVMVLSIQSIGWRQTMVVLGIIFLIVGPLVSLVIRKKPNLDFNISKYSTKKINITNIKPKQALKTHNFWIIAICHLLANVSVGAISAHIFLYLTDYDGVNLTIYFAGTILPLIALVSFIGQISGGILGDIYNKRILLPLLFLVQSISLVILAFANSFIDAIIFSVIWGIGFGMRTPILHSIRGEFFGGRHYGTILGLNAFPMGIGMMLSPVIVGFIYDSTNTYFYSLLSMAFLCIAASFLILLIKSPNTKKDL